MNRHKFFFFLLFLVFSERVAAVSQSENQPALWEYGAGLGFIRYQHYPASNQHNDITLPFPAIQYRGEILRANDRDGARAYLLRESRWTLDVGGGVLPSVKSQDNAARTGMDTLLWSIQMGPRIVYEINEDLDLSLGFYQSFASDFKFTKFNGYVFEQKLDYALDELFRKANWLETKNYRSRLTVSLISGSSEYLSTIYDVDSKDETSERPTYRSREGFLSYEIKYFQTLRFGRFSFYTGVSDLHYNLSANRNSPLHKSDENILFFAGLIYKLGESKRRAVPEEDAEGLLQKIKVVP